MQYIATHLCRVNGRGEIVIVRTRKTFAAGVRMEAGCGLHSREFVVRSYVANDPADNDHGTVYFVDANGELLADAPVNC